MHKKLQYFSMHHQHISEAIVLPDDGLLKLALKLVSHTEGRHGHQETRGSIKTNFLVKRQEKEGD